MSDLYDLIVNIALLYINKITFIKNNYYDCINIFLVNLWYFFIKTNTSWVNSLFILNFFNWVKWFESINIYKKKKSLIG